MRPEVSVAMWTPSVWCVWSIDCDRTKAHDNAWTLESSPIEQFQVSGACGGVKIGLDSWVLEVFSVWLKKCEERLSQQSRALEGHFGNPTRTDK